MDAWGRGEVVDGKGWRLRSCRLGLLAEIDVRPLFRSWMGVGASTASEVEVRSSSMV